MTRWIRSHPYTLGAVVVFAALIAWCVYNPRPWWEYGAAALYGVGYGCANAPRCRPARREPPPWHPSGPSLPCPPECRVQAAHRHDPVEAFR